MHGSEQPNKIQLSRSDRDLKMADRRCFIIG